MREIRILPTVLHDIADAAAWYDKNGYAGLGEHFIETIYLFIAQIQKCGEIYRVVYQDFRKILLRPFPYAVFYRLHEGVRDCVFGDSCCKES